MPASNRKNYQGDRDARRESQLSKTEKHFTVFFYSLLLLLLYPSKEQRSNIMTRDDTVAMDLNYITPKT
jgi:hypothetical protein